MSRLSMILNGWDCSLLFNRRGVSFQQIKVEGANSGISMGGTTIVDLIRVKDYWILPGNGVSAGDYARLLSLSRNDYLSATYLSPESETLVTKTMIPTLSAATRTPFRSGKVWYEGWSLTLEER